MQRGIRYPSRAAKMEAEAHYTRMKQRGPIRTADEFLDRAREFPVATGRLVEPFGALLEAHELAAYVAQPIIREAICRVRPADQDYRTWLTILPAFLRSAQVYFWTDEMWDTAKVAGEGYQAEGQSWRSDWFPSPASYWAWQTDRSVVMLPGIEEWQRKASGLYSDLILANPLNGKVTLVAMILLDGLIVPTPMLLGQVGEPVLSAPPSARPATSMVAGMLEFLQSPWVRAEAYHPARPERRRWVKEHQADPPTVRVVTLRRRGQSTGGGSPEAPDWSCRWFVRGHWRDQWYRSSASHRRIWIAPYVKGPEEKPIKPPQATVFAVVR